METDSTVSVSCPKSPEFLRLKLSVRLTVLPLSADGFRVPGMSRAVFFAGRDSSAVAGRRASEQWCPKISPTTIPESENADCRVSEPHGINIPFSM